MYLKPLFEGSPEPHRRKSNSTQSSVKSWVLKAIVEEDRKPLTQLWYGEPTADDQIQERQRRVRFLRKHAKLNANLYKIAFRLDSCEHGQRCCSGACPECNWLLQRAFVRKSKSLIRDEIEQENCDLVAITIIPSQPIIRLDELHTFSINNLQRRIKFALDKASVDVALGGIDISFNEDRDSKYKPFWCVHAYLITSTHDRKHLSKMLKKLFKRDRRILRPVKISDFENLAGRRSYALKTLIIRRVGEDVIKLDHGKLRKCRNTSKDRLRAKERALLFPYQDQIGLANRCIFHGAKPVVKSEKVYFSKAKRKASYQAKL